MFIRFISFFYCFISIILKFEESYCVTDSMNSDFEYTSQQNIENYVSDIAAILLKYKADPSEVVFEAAKAGDIDSVEKLSKYGVDLFEIKNGINISDAACCGHSGNSLEMLFYLIEKKGIYPTKNPFYSLIKSHKSIPLKKIDYFLSLDYAFPEELIFFLMENTSPKIEEIEAIICRGINLTCLNDIKYSERSRHLLNHIFSGPPMKPKLWYQQTLAAENMNSNKEMINLFIKYGIDVNKEISFIKCNKPIFINHHQYYGIYNTPLLISIANNDIDMVINLINAGADVNMEGKESFIVNSIRKNQGHINNINEITPLKLAVKYDHNDIVVILLENGAKIK